LQTLFQSFVCDLRDSDAHATGVEHGVHIGGAARLVVRRHWTRGGNVRRLQPRAYSGEIVGEKKNRNGTGFGGRDTLFLLWQTWGPKQANGSAQRFPVAQGDGPAFRGAGRQQSEGAGVR